MAHAAIDQVLHRADLAKEDSDFTYFSDLLLAAEALAKLVTLGILSAVVDDKDRHRYRVAHALVRAEGLGIWAQSLEDLVKGPASQFLLADAYNEQAQLTRSCREGEWQYQTVASIKEALSLLDIECEDLPLKTDMTRWFRLLTVLRNKTKAHGATKASSVASSAKRLRSSIGQLYSSFSLFSRPWANLSRNLSGKYRVSAIAGDCSVFDFLKKQTNHNLPDGVHIWWGSPRRVPLLVTNPELDDFYFANGAYGNTTYELLSYTTGHRRDGDSAAYSAHPGTLPQSETHGVPELLSQGNCLSNAPKTSRDYVDRPALQASLLELLVDRRREIVTLRGRGGIGKTSLALRVLQDVYTKDRFVTVIWLSSRDVDLRPSGPKAVQPDVVSPDDIALLYSKLVLSEEELKRKDFRPKSFFEQQLNLCETGPCLFVFDNFETTQNPIEVFNWIDTYIRLPNKVLITTRLRDFRGDYPLEVLGMTEKESMELINKTAAYHGITELLTKKLIEEIIEKSAGHPYVIKILLGEMAKTKRPTSVPHLIAGSSDILIALFERTYAALTPCAQRAFLTLSGWASSVPRIALEAVLLRSTQERHQVETGIDMLVQYSLAESHEGQDNQEFLSLPLVAAAFGKKKLNISPNRSAIQNDIEILQMFGPSRRDDLHLGLARKLEHFVSLIAKRTDDGHLDGYSQILDMICRNYPAGWLAVARWYGDSNSGDGLEKAEKALERFLENDPNRSDVWQQLARIRLRKGDSLGELHALLSRSKLPETPYSDISETANKLNWLTNQANIAFDVHEKKDFSSQLLSIMESRINEANADDYSRMAWLALHLGQEGRAQQFVKSGLAKESANTHCLRLASRIGIESQ